MSPGPRPSLKVTPSPRTLDTVFTGSNKVPPGTGTDHGTRHRLSRHSSVKTSKYPSSATLLEVVTLTSGNSIEIWALCSSAISSFVIWIICFVVLASEIKRRWRRFMQEWGIIITTYWKLDSRTQSCKKWANDLAIIFVENNKFIQTGKTWRRRVFTGLISDRWGDPSILKGI